MKRTKLSTLPLFDENTTSTADSSKPKRTKKAVIASRAEASTVGVMVTDAEIEITEGIRRRKKQSIPRTEEGSVDWRRFVPEIITSRPEGMPFDVYKQALKDQAKRLKIGKRA